MVSLEYVKQFKKEKKNEDGTTSLVQKIYDTPEEEKASIDRLYKDFNEGNPTEFPKVCDSYHHIFTNLIEEKEIWVI